MILQVLLIQGPFQKLLITGNSFHDCLLPLRLRSIKKALNECILVNVSTASHLFS